MITDDPRFDHVLVCRTCQVLWLDEAAIRLLAIPQDLPPAPSTSLDERKTLALIRVAQLQQEFETKRSLSRAPDSWLGRILTLLGLPYLEDPMSGISSAWVTVTTVALMVATTLLSLPHLEILVHTYGFIPHDPWRSGGLTLVSAFFLHAGIWHLVSNSYVLLLFGPAVENRLGSLRFAALLASAAVLGDLSHAIWDPHQDLPLVGASGGISAILVFYACELPRSRIYLRVIVLLTSIPAWVALVLWLLLQACNGWLQIVGLSSVSAMAHLGGATIGFLGWGWWRLIRTKRPTKPIQT